MRHKTDTMLLVWPLLVALSDFLLLTGSLMIALYIRFYFAPFTQVVPVIYGVPPTVPYFYSSLIGAGFWVLFMAVRGSYRIDLERSLLRDAWEAMVNFVFAFAITFAFLFFYREFLYSRVVAVLTLFIGLPLLFFARVVLRTLRRWIFPTRPFHRALIIGPNGRALADRLSDNEGSGLVVVDLFSGDNLPEVEALAELVKEQEVDTVLLAYGFGEFARVRNLIEAMGGHRINFLLAPDPQALIVGRMRTIRLAGMPLLQLRENPLAGWNGLLKGAFDIVVSATLLLLLSPLLLLLALLVKLTSHGPVFYRQQRVGLDGRAFTMIKFRTMRVGAEKESGPVWAKPNDPRTTPVGAFLRRWSLDELPQLWNVLRRDMSLVGPRPERPEFVEQFRSRVPRYAERHRVRSGMTGWAQVSGLRGQTSIDERTRYDLMYIENWSLGLDLLILARTFVAVLFGQDAY